MQVHDNGLFDNEVANTIADVQQSRSRFQMEKFVVGQHRSPEMRFMQICLELQSMEYAVALSYLNERHAQVKIDKHRSKGTELGEIKAEKQELALRKMQLVRVGAMRELQLLREMFNESHHYTREEIERAQPEYWRERLTRHHALQTAAGTPNWSMLDTMIQAEIMESPEEARVRSLNSAPAGSISA